METHRTRFDVIVIGGGLGGIAASYCLASLGKRVALIDNSLPVAEGQLGGFAKFSGAKFSLLPAGQGLIPVAGSLLTLERTIADVLEFLGLQDRGSTASTDLQPDRQLEVGLALRSYKSILLSSDQIGALLHQITGIIRQVVDIKKGKILRLARLGNDWHAISESGELARASIVIFAGGRVSGSLLGEAGAQPQEGKGLDVGVRIEFLNKRAVDSLRSLGPDAKILHSRCRTFCLNSPGKVYRCGFEGISIPGGVVAEGSHPSANVGLLHRLAAKSAVRKRVVEHLSGMDREYYENSAVVMGKPFQEKTELIEGAYGNDAAMALLTFAGLLGVSGMVEWDAPHRIHFPLLDWHWDTYAVDNSHRTSVKDLWVVGDCAGHARGLLQAAISGWLAAQEVVADEAK